MILHNLLPEGAAIPANRGQLALLIWTEKGKPEPAAQPAFADITDAEQAKALSVRGAGSAGCTGRQV